jgi:hypothetical protein
MVWQLHHRNYDISLRSITIALGKGKTKCQFSYHYQPGWNWALSSCVIEEHQHCLRKIRHGDLPGSLLLRLNFVTVHRRRCCFNPWRMCWYGSCIAIIITYYWGVLALLLEGETKCQSSYHYQLDWDWALWLWYNRVSPCDSCWPCWQLHPIMCH